MNLFSASFARRISIFVLLPITLLLVAACGSEHRAARPGIVAGTASGPSLFAAETECAPCHSDISKAHHAGRHAASLHFVDNKVVDKTAPPIGPIPKTRYVVTSKDGRLVFGNEESAEKSRAVDLAFGSGKIGITYVALNGDETLEEMRMSYVPKKNRWYITPGQEDLWDHDLGYIHSADSARACLGCHTSTLPATSIRPEPQYLGIGCQACHGPAAAHVAAAKSGRMKDLRIERASQWLPSKINQVCGKCHRSPADVGTTGNEITMTQRFQAYGLEQSPCFQKSGGRLSCVSCHNAHTNVSTDAHSYEAVCLKCHGGSPPPPGDATAWPGKVCSVNARTKCIGCHMPDRQVFPRSGIEVPMADHLIWAYRDKK